MVPLLITVSLPYFFSRNVLDAFIAQKAFSNDWPWWLNSEQREKHHVTVKKLTETSLLAVVKVEIKKKKFPMRLIYIF